MTRDFPVFPNFKHIRCSTKMIPDSMESRLELRADSRLALSQCVNPGQRSSM